MYSQQQFGTIIQPQTYERSFSPLLTDDEEWKVSSSPYPTTNQQDYNGRMLIQMPSIHSNHSSPTKKKKALPETPVSCNSNYTPSQDAYQFNSPAYFAPVQQEYSYYYNAPMPATPMSATNPECSPYPAHDMYYHPQQQQQQQQPYMDNVNYSYPSSPSSCPDEPEEPPTSGYAPAPAPSHQQQQQQPQFQDPPKPPQNKNVRQITVKSINNDYRVWITVEPKETGESIAEKIHTIATFRTRKITSVTTASGRQVLLNKTPVFKHWEDMDDFENGETWTVTWGPLKKSFMDKVLSKFIET